LAHFSNDKNLITAFKKDYDIHTYTAKRVFGVSEKDVTKRMRDQAKTVNFAIIYGISPYGLSRDLGIDVSEAADFINNYFERYPDVKRYLDNQIEDARRKGYVTTILHRRRYLPEITSKNNNIRQFAERQAINAPIQGSAADLIKVAMLNIDAAFKKNRMTSKMILQVHDELIFDAARDEAPLAKKIIRSEMEHVHKLKVPILVHMGGGKNWFETGK
jgi:DNA polymerase-1